MIEQDNLIHIPVTFYKCEVMGEDCSLCISLGATKPQYNCQWCGGKGCLYKDTCASKFTTSSCPRAELRGVSHRRKTIYYTVIHSLISAFCLQ